MKENQNSPRRGVELSTAFVVVIAIVVIGAIAIAPYVAWLAAVALGTEEAGVVPKNETVAISAISGVSGFAAGLIGGTHMSRKRDDEENRHPVHATSGDPDHEWCGVGEASP